MVILGIEIECGEKTLILLYMFFVNLGLIYISRFLALGGGHSWFKDSDGARIREKRNSFWEKVVNIEEFCWPSDEWLCVRRYTRDNFNNSNEPISYVYWELSPVAGPSLTHQTRNDPARSLPPIVEDDRYGLFQPLGLTRLDMSVFNWYTQMVINCYSPLYFGTRGWKGKKILIEGMFVKS